MQLVGLIRLLALGLLAIPSLAACGGGDPLTSLSLSPTTISPNETSTNRIANLDYVLTRRSDVTVSFSGPDGVVRTLRDHQTRTPGSYTLQFDGAFDGHVLPNGVYHWTFMVSDTATHQVLDTRTKSLTITNADTSAPTITQPSVFPSPFHPNGNLGTDTATFTYLLSKPSQVTIAAVGPQGTPLPQTYDVLYQEAQQAGPNQATWTGQISPEQYVPDGTYDWTIQATDGAGNVSSVKGTVAVAQSGVADARITGVKAIEVDQNGQRMIQVQVAIYNTGNATLYGDVQPGAPQSGFTYGSLEANYLNPPPFGPGWGEQAIGRAGTYSIGASYTERGLSTAPPYPFRWSLGQPLAPHASRVITGTIKLPASFHGQATFFAGIIHEGQGILSGQDQIPAPQVLVLP
ncbi:MAG TPA: hypothetical protein VIU62_03265 [Chloroflexota bacterium]